MSSNDDGTTAELRGNYAAVAYEANIAGATVRGKMAVPFGIETSEYLAERLAEDYYGEYISIEQWNHIPRADLTGESR